MLIRGSIGLSPRSHLTSRTAAALPHHQPRAGRPRADHTPAAAMHASLGHTSMRGALSSTTRAGISPHHQQQRQVLPSLRHRGRTLTPAAAAAAKSKGFGGKQEQQQQQAEQQQAAAPVAEPAPPAASREDEVEALLRRRKNRRVVEPQVKVESAVVDMATGKTPTNAVGEAEGRVLQALGAFFTLLLVEGLLLAGSGFLPPDWDGFIADVLYPSFSPQMLLFLGMSSAYGLYKTGKLPGQQQLK